MPKMTCLALTKKIKIKLLIIIDIRDNSSDGVKRSLLSIMHRADNRKYLSNKSEPQECVNGTEMC